MAVRRCRGSGCRQVSSLVYLTGRGTSILYLCPSTSNVRRRTSSADRSDVVLSVWFVVKGSTRMPTSSCAKDCAFSASSLFEGPVGSLTPTVSVILLVKLLKLVHDHLASLGCLKRVYVPGNVRSKCSESTPNSTGRRSAVPLNDLQFNWGGRQIANGKRWRHFGSFGGFPEE
jgi:hypothetical protein